jgi:hypothetical protein
MTTQTTSTLSKEASMLDLDVNFGSFSATSFVVRALTERGFAFLAAHCGGAGCTGFEAPKSSFEHFARTAHAESVRF